MKSDVRKQVERRLYDYTFNLSRISAIKKRLEELEPDTLKSSAYLEIGNNNKNSDIVAKEAIRISDFEDMLKKELKRREIDVFEIDKAMECLTQIENKVIVMRYFKLNKMGFISDTLCYSREYLSRICKRAVIKIQKVLYGVSEEGKENF